MFKNFWVGNIDYDVEKIIKTKFKHEFDGNYPKDASHMYTEYPDNYKQPLGTN